MRTSNKGPVRVESQLEREMSVVMITIKGDEIRGNSFHAKNNDFDLFVERKNEIPKTEIKIEIVILYKKKWMGHKKLSPIKKKIPKNRYGLKGYIVLKQRMYCSSGWRSNTKVKTGRANEPLGFSKPKYTNYKTTNVKRPYQGGLVTPR